jgi:predicted DNA repair protein MutK
MAKFSEKKQLFCFGKAMGRTNQDLAKELNICEKTASVWNGDPVIREKIQALQVENWLESQRLLISLQTQAIKVLDSLLESENESIRLKASATLLSLCSAFPEYL